jgi:hypothetical protein
MTETKPMPPGETRGTEITRFNALRHGVLSRYTVLPWEDPDEYHALVTALVAEHRPQGPTEEHLVEELAGILWRKRRLRLAEAAAHRRGLESTFSSYGDTAKAALAHITKADKSVDVSEAVHITPADTEDELGDRDEDEAKTRRALDILNSRSNDAYETALAELREDTQGWWADTLTLKPDELDEDEEPAASDADAEGLRRFLEDKVLPWFEKRKEEIGQRPLLRDQAFGESLDPDKLVRLGRYEVHLDRKLERMLAMLLRLKDLRQGQLPTESVSQNAGNV